MAEFISTTLPSPENHGKCFRVLLGVDYSVRQLPVGSGCFPCLILYHGTTRNFRVQRVHGDIVLIPCVFRVSFSMTELHGIFVFWSCTVIPFLFRMFTVFNFRSRNHTELWCMTTSYWFREFSVSHFQWRNCTELSCTVCACTRKSCSFRVCSVWPSMTTITANSYAYTHVRHPPS